VERWSRDYTKRKTQNKEDYLLVIRSVAKAISEKAVNATQDEELKNILSGLLEKEYYSNKDLYRKHKQMYKE
jgi:hypothetical protein